METTIIDRLKDFIEKKGTSLQEIRTKIKLGHGTLNKSFKKNEGIRSDYVENILSLWPETTDKEKYFIYTGKVLEEVSETQPYLLQPSAIQDPIVSMYQWMTKIERDIDLIKRELDVIKKS